MAITNRRRFILSGLVTFLDSSWNPPLLKSLKVASIQLRRLPQFKVVLQARVAPQLSVVMESMSSFRVCVVMTHHDKNSVNAMSERIYLYDSFYCSFFYFCLGLSYKENPLDPSGILQIWPYQALCLTPLAFWRSKEMSAVSSFAIL